MLSFLKKMGLGKRVKPSTPPLDVVALPALSDEEIPRYPPFMKGLPVIAPERLVGTQLELIAKIRETAIVTGATFDTHFLGSINRFAAYAHLLPASQSHHHRGAGGLLRHAVEVGLWAMQAADKMLLDIAKTPQLRRELEPRWQYAVFAAALCHDAGKPVTDVIITSRDRGSIWKPIREDLYSWATANCLDAYFIEWREGRSKQHTALSNLIADRIIGPESLEWIGETNTELIVWLMESLNCNPSPNNPMHDIVVKSDQASVERDLKTLGVAMAGYDIGVPIERHLTDIMRRLVKERVWRVNEPGARVWNIDGHIYLVWPAVGEDLARQIREDGVPGIPRSPDGILDMLVDRELAFMRHLEGGGADFWKIRPAVLAEKIPEIKLSCIRLRDDNLISAVPVPAVDGLVIVEATASPKAPESNAPAVQKKEVPVAVASPVSPEPNIDRSTGEILPPVAVIDSVCPEEISSSSSIEIRPAVGSAALEQPMQRPVPEKTQEVPSPPPGKDGKVQEAVDVECQIGEALRFIIEQLNKGKKSWGEDALIDPEGFLRLRWPNAFAGLGFTSKFILDELGGRDWLWADPLAPLKKIIDTEFSDGVAKSIRLERNITFTLEREVGFTVAQSATKSQESDGGYQCTDSPLGEGDAPRVVHEHREPGVQEGVSIKVAADNEISEQSRGSTQETEVLPREKKKKSRLAPKGGATTSARSGDQKESQASSLPSSDSHETNVGAEEAGSAEKSRMAPIPASHPVSYAGLIPVLVAIEQFKEDGDGMRTCDRSLLLQQARRMGIKLRHGDVIMLGSSGNADFILEGSIVKYRIAAS